MTSRERISGIDTAWLRMEHPTNLMMIVGVLMFREKLGMEQVRRALEGRWLSHVRFRQSAMQDTTGAWWQTDRQFDLRHHLHKVRLPGRADKNALQNLVSRLSSQGLDFSRPLWDFHLVENYNGGSALIARIHHCYADGIALIGVILSMTGNTSQESLRLPKPAKSTSTEEDFLASLLGPVSGMWKNATKLSRTILGQGLEIARHPAIASDLAEKGIKIAEEVGRIAMMESDSPTRFKGKLGKSKRVAWAEPLPLDEVKVIGKALGCSVNDVLLSTAAGALREYLLQEGDRTEGIEIRAVVPVNLRPPQQSGRLGNQFGLVFVYLPVGIGDPLLRARLVRERMQALKGSYQPLVTFALLHAVGLGPKMVQDQVSALIGKNASAVMTNVPGPQHPLFFAGKEITELDFWVPQSGGIGMGVSILSYNGKVQFGIITDEGLVPDPEQITRHFGEQFESLVLATLMGPYGPEFEQDLQIAFDAPPAQKVPKRFRRT